ncbi:hypothetical protein K461DRAFT_112054 [Myriangium duriaei CBS 260.36]|uniref:Uncharacterized protein n=1 Tax=Myriangium duriaei CBS 260.36 TaxID=1168546 RepID=A0A9P4J8G1_9PEZI|nr:hypothetical protein K461DRAFT_112054 [Myriangium duriaei CBS 260.36]
MPRQSRTASHLIRPPHIRARPIFPGMCLTRGCNSRFQLGEAVCNRCQCESPFPQPFQCTPKLVPVAVNATARVQTRNTSSKETRCTAGPPRAPCRVTFRCFRFIIFATDELGCDEISKATTCASVSLIARRSASKLLPNTALLLR